MTRQADILNDEALRHAANEMKQIEISAIDKSDSTIVHSEAELSILKNILIDVTKTVRNNSRMH
jgi:hypothetical protein